MVNIPEIIDTIPYAFWKSLAFQQINKRSDLKVPKWSILVNDTGVQCSLFWACNDYDDLESVSKDERMEMDAKISQKSMSLSPIEAPVKECNSDALDLGLTGLPALLQNALKRQQAMTPSGGSDRQSSPSPKSEMEEVLNARKIQDVISQITAQSCNGERPSKIRRKTTPIKPEFRNLNPSQNFGLLGNSASNIATIQNEASKRLIELKQAHLASQHTHNDSSSGPFGSSLLNMAKAAQQQCNNGTHTATIEIEEIESIEHISTPNSSLDIKPDPDDGLDPIERIAAKTGTLQTLQKMRTEAERGTLNLSKAVRLLARCLFNEDELVVESIKDLDQHKVDLLHAETARWYNCTMTEVRQVMSFRLSEIRKTKRASHWSKRGPYSSNLAPSGNNLSLPSLLHDPSFILPQLTDVTSRTNDSPNFPLTITSSISPTNSK